MTSTDMSRRTRLATYGAVSTALSLHSDRRLRELVDAGTPTGSGIGGQTVRVEVGGVPVFVKRVRLTDLERRPENVRSTANLFDLPMFCHFGVGTIGGPGFGAWRELAVHDMTTGWVLGGEHEAFPMMYHWRVLPDDGHALPDELADVDRAVAYWDDDPAVRHRIDSLRTSTASVTLFLEHVPQSLHDWLGARVEEGADAAESACAMVERELGATVAFMGDQGLLHLDAHFQNVLTDGTRLFLTDFGLALSTRFELEQEEARFLDEHRGYDRAYAATHLVSWWVVALYGLAPEERRAFVRACADGAPPPGVPPGVAATISRHAPVAATTGEFFRRFQRESRRTPYPAGAVDRDGRRGAWPGSPGARG
ncbi:protein kinase family protein [Cellulosimicrobium cellulans]|uniref:protein kinase family protein n=1 Tax=Cellulosimicrobium cellulans TaxID=1710 RepID=UPI0020CDF170|nr:protein kinase family protein [Cellulosimicrobium cellulans]